MAAHQKMFIDPCLNDSAGWMQQQLVWSGRVYDVDNSAMYEWLKANNGRCVYGSIDPNARYVSCWTEGGELGSMQSVPQECCHQVYTLQQIVDAYFNEHDSSTPVYVMRVKTAKYDILRVHRVRRKGVLEECVFDSFNLIAGRYIHGCTDVKISPSYLATEVVLCPAHRLQQATADGVFTDTDIKTPPAAVSRGVRVTEKQEPVREQEHEQEQEQEHEQEQTTKETMMHSLKTALDESLNHMKDGAKLAAAGEAAELLVRTFHDMLNHARPGWAELLPDGEHSQRVQAVALAYLVKCACQLYPLPQTPAAQGICNAVLTYESARLFQPLMRVAASFVQQLMDNGGHALAEAWTKVSSSSTDE